MSQQQVFGLTAVDVAAATASLAAGAAPPAAPLSPMPAPSDTPAPSTSQLPDIQAAASSSTYLTEVPLGASAAASPRNVATPTGRGAKAPLAPMAQPLQPTSQPMAGQPSQPPSASATAPGTPASPNGQSNSERAMDALVNSFTIPLQPTKTRLPPISKDGSSGTGTGSSASGGAAAAATAAASSGGGTSLAGGRGGAGTPAPAAAAAASGRSPDREHRQRMSTPQSRVLTPNDPNRDTRVFDGRDLHELVRVSTENYSDVARLQRIVQMSLGGKSTEASKAEALLLVREASIQNPLFSLTPTMVELVKEQLMGRNRMLRPAAAYALAGYAANSRHGRGLMTVNVWELMPRLNAMLKCRVDSMDARYASLAVAAASLHPENKEAVGRSGSIPLLIGLLRQNLGRHHVSPYSGENGLEAVLSLTRSVTSSEDGSARPTSGESASQLHPMSAGGTLASSSGPPTRTPLSGFPSVGGGSLSTEHSTLSSPGFSPPPPIPPPPAPPPTGSTTARLHGGMPMADLPDRRGLMTVPPRSEAAAAAAAAAGATAVPVTPIDGGKGTYVLSVKPAAAHAAAALVNLAELPSNRYRMREAGIATLLEDALASRNDNCIKERCRLLVDLLQMDTARYREAKAEIATTTLAYVGQAAINFVRHTSTLAAHRAALAAAAAAGLTSTAHGAGGNSPGTLGSPNTRSSLTWTLARQLDRGIAEEDDRFANMLGSNGATAAAGGEAGGRGGTAAAAMVRQHTATGRSPPTGLPRGHSVASRRPGNTMSLGASVAAAATAGDAVTAGLSSRGGLGGAAGASVVTTTITAINAAA